MFAHPPFSPTPQKKKKGEGGNPVTSLLVLSGSEEVRNVGKRSPFSLRKKRRRGVNANTVKTWYFNFKSGCEGDSALWKLFPLQPRMSVWLKTKQLDSWREFCPSFGPGTLFLVEGLGVVCGGGFCAQPPNRGWFKASSGQWLETYLHRVVEMYPNFQGGLKTHESIDWLEITGLSLLYSIDYNSLSNSPFPPSSVREI